MLQREAAETAHAAGRDVPGPWQATYVGGMLEMCSARLYQIWGTSPKPCAPGEPQNEAKSGGQDLFTGSMPIRIAPSVPERHDRPEPRRGDGGWRRNFPGPLRRLRDIGCAQGGVPVQLALAHPISSVLGMIFPSPRPIFEDYIASHNLQERLSFVGGDMSAMMAAADDVYPWATFSMTGGWRRRAVDQGGMMRCRRADR